jgi:hypothetical protein
VRRLLIAIAVALLATSAPVFARPKVAVTPLKGDADDKVGEVLRDALAGKLAVVPPKDVARALDKLGVSGELDEQDVQRLRLKTNAAVVVQGKLGRAGAKKTLKVSVWVRGKRPSDFTVQYKSAASENFREGVREAIVNRIGKVDDLEDADRPKKKVAAADDEKPKKKKKSDDEDRPKKKKADDDEKPKKKVAAADDEKPKKKKSDDEDKPKKKKKADDDEKPKKKVAAADDEKPKKKKSEDEDKPKKKKVAAAAAADDDDGKVRKRRKRGGGEGDGPGVSAQVSSVMVAARVDVGISAGVRRLTYALKANAMTPPPPLGTPGAAGRIEAELYPFAFSNRRSKLAGLGFVGDFDKTFGVSIDVPNSGGKSAPIDQAHYSVGMRYQIAIGASAFELGARYARRHYIADRSALAMAAQLDAPDVDYTAIAPGLGVRLRAAPKVALFATADAMLILSTGAIQKSDSYGPANVFGIDAGAGLDIALGKSLALRFAAEYTQINFSFSGTGAMAAARGVEGATDRQFGLAATLAAKY